MSSFLYPDAMKKTIATTIILLTVLILTYWFVKAHPPKEPISNLSLGELVADASYRCEDNKTVRAKYYTGWVELTLSDGRIVTVPQALAASGVRYANRDESFIFWNKSREAFIEELGVVSYKDCKEQNKGTNVSTTSDTNATVTVLELVEDSRCASDVECIQAGTVRVKARVSRNGKTEDAIFTLNEPKIISGTTVTLSKVSPERISGIALTFKDYKFTFAIE
jgi:membrane-bound inhibitor of C-type lysozyme